MGCGGLCVTPPANAARKRGGACCDDCARDKAWQMAFNPWAATELYPPVGANPYDESTGFAGGDLSRDKNTLAPAGTFGPTSTGGSSGIPQGAWNTIDAGIAALGAFAGTLANNDVERARIAAQRDAAAAGASDAVISALGGRAPQYTTSNTTAAPGDRVYSGGSSSSSSTPWLVAAAIAAAALLFRGKGGIKL